MSRDNHAGPVQQKHNRLDGYYTAGLPGCLRCIALKEIHDCDVVANATLRLDIIDLKVKIQALQEELDARRERIYFPDREHSPDNGLGGR
jgi:hypothetical protein